VGGEVLDKAESMLLDWAADFDPVILGRFGTRILDHVAPQIADRREADLLAKQDARAYRRRAFTLSPVGAGLVRLTGWLDATGAATVNAALDPLCHPRLDDPSGPRTPAQRRADALIDVCTAALRGEVGLPGQGGDPAQVVVTVPFATLTDRPVMPNRPAADRPRADGPATDRPATDRPAADRPGADRPATDGPGADRPGADLPAMSGWSRVGDAPTSAETAPGPGSGTRARTCNGTPRANTHTGTAGSHTGTRADSRADGRGVGAGWLDTGAPISAAEARRMACDAQILPAVLDSNSQPLDLGRARRLFTGPIRRALILRDHGCSFPGCDRPARWSEGHHLQAWADGGTTDLTNACLICRHHRVSRMESEVLM